MSENVFHWALKIDPDPRMHHVCVHIYNQLHCLKFNVYIPDKLFRQLRNRRQTMSIRFIRALMPFRNSNEKVDLYLKRNVQRGY